VQLPIIDIARNYSHVHANTTNWSIHDTEAQLLEFQCNRGSFSQSTIKKDIHKGEILALNARCLMKPPSTLLAIVSHLYLYQITHNESKRRMPWQQLSQVNLQCTKLQCDHWLSTKEMKSSMTVKNEPSWLTKHNFKSMQEITAHLLWTKQWTIGDKVHLISPPKSSNLSVTYLPISNNKFTNRDTSHRAFRIVSVMAVIKLRLSTVDEKFTVTIDCHRI